MFSGKEFGTKYFLAKFAPLDIAKDRNMAKRIHVLQE